MKVPASRWPILASVVLAAAVGGCRATRPDIAADVAGATGLTRAIVVRDEAESLNGLEADPESLTAGEVVRLALAHDPRIQSAVAKVRAAEADANQARLLPNPVLGVDMRFPGGNKGGQVFEVSLSEDIVQILQKPAAVSAADNRLRGAAAEALGVVLDVITEAQTTFVSAREVEEEVRAATTKDAGLRRVRDIAVLREKAGDASRVEVATFDSQIAQGALDLADLRLRRAELRLKLGKLIGRPGGVGEWQLLEGGLALPPVADEQAWVESGLRHRPEILSKVWELKALGDDVDVAGWSPLAGASVGGHAERDGAWRGGPTLSTPLPLFDWGQESRAKAEAQRVMARHDLLELCRAATVEIRLAHAAYVEAVKSLAEARRDGGLLSLAGVQVEQARLAYRVGEADLATELLAEADYSAAAARVAKLEESAHNNRLRLERAVGGASFGRLSGAGEGAVR
jgi:outer membrane protein, heavy metal efflux system